MFTVGETGVEPEVAPPVENPIPEQEVALLDDQESVDDSPKAILSGFAVKTAATSEPVSCKTCTVSESLALPFTPVQDRVKVVFA